MKKILVMLIVVLTVASPVFRAFAAENSTNSVAIFIAPDGNDTLGNGTINSPYKTLEAARDRIRELKSTGDYNGGITVYMRGGVYNIDKTFILNSNDSGTEQSPIIYTNYPGEEVTLLGGRSFGAEAFKPAQEDALLDRLVDQSVRDKIYMLDLKSNGIESVGEPTLFGSYSYNSYYSDFLTAPNIIGVEPFFNGKPLTSARYPNEDEGRISAPYVYEKGWSSDDKGSSDNPADSFVIGIIDDGHINKWNASVSAQNGSKNKVLMNGWWRYDWCDQSIPIKSIEASNDGVVKVTSTHSAYLCPTEDYGTRAFYVYNLIEELDIPGEYYLDYDTCVLYVYPPENIENSKIDISLTPGDIVSLNKAENIIFAGINISTTRKHAYYINECKNIEIRDCEISGTGSKGVYITASSNCGITDSYLHDVNGGVVLSGGDVKTLTSGNNYVKNCHIENFSRLTKNNNGAVDVGGVGNRVSNNRIHGGPHLAISFGGQKNDIIYNEIYDVCRECYDVGAIYGGRTWVGRGCKIMYNYFHNIKTASTGAMGVCAVYLDGGQSDMTVSSNVFHNIDGGCVWIGGGQDNIVQNNYFTDSGYGLWLQNPMASIDLNKNHYSGYNSLDVKVDFSNNDYWKSEFPKLYDFMAQSDDDKRLPKNNTFSSNISYNTGLYRGDENCKAEGYIENINTINLVTETDPGFADYDGDDFTLSGEEAALENLEDFEPIEFDKIGTKEAHSTQLPLLESVYLGEEYDIDFNSNKYDYEIEIPYCINGITLPDVTAIAQNPDAQVEISYPSNLKIIDGVGYITITVTLGDAHTEYRIYINAIGRNLYLNGGAERAPWYSGTGYWWTAERIDEGVGSGAYSISHNGGSYYLPGGKNPLMLEKDKTYLASSMVRKASDFVPDLDVVSEVKKPASNGTVDAFNGIVNHYLADGSKAENSRYTLLSDEWLTHYRTITPLENSEVADIYTVRGLSESENFRAFHFVTDEYFLGELVIAKLKITDKNGKVPCDMISSQTEKTELSLDALAFNQLGNNIGLENEKVSLWKLTKPLDGVNLDSNSGVLTINAKTEGQIEIEATVIPSYIGAYQDEVKEQITINIRQEGFTCVKDNDKAEISLLYENKSSKIQNLNLYYVLYEIKGNQSEMTELLEKKSFTLQAGETINEERTFSLPLLDKYRIKSFLWQENMVPIIQSGVIN